MNKLITYIRQLFVAIEEVSDWSLVRQHSAYNSQDIERCPFEFTVVFDNDHQAVCDNRNINLYPHSVLNVAPEGRDSEMLLYSSEEQFNLPSLFLQQSDVTGFERKIDHIVGELFKYSVVLVRISVGNITELDVSASKSEMVTLILDGVNNAEDLPEAVAAGKLSEYHYKKLVPACERFHILIASILLDYSIKYSLGQKLGELTEKIFSAIHSGLGYIRTSKLRNQFKSARTIFAYNLL